ncbi:N-acetyltransferase family protein [Limibacterium fermenti]|uniref:GNAT family N-acetyltransferase n=1 Tax=Limibacterium fermenti TaxID=3229863 RepID=UPI000E882B5A|nr:phosphinothricin acetyltransferase [Porphyromonadaceae bacterium]
MIRKVRAEDASQIRDIYNYYIRETVVTFEEEEISSEEMLRRIDEVTKRYPWIVYEENGALLGYAYASEFRERIAYRLTAESTVYLRHGQEGKGIGIQLYEHLISELKRTDIHAVIGCITLPNVGSVHLHEKLGFRKNGVFPQTGYKFGKWLDVGFWELIL